MHLDAMNDLTGAELGVSDWVTVDQERIARFAEATDDHQWIHVDEERSNAGPFGGPIAHGYLVLSMLPVLLGPFMKIDGVRMQLNYGVDRVRFPQAVRVGSRIRARASVEAVDEKPSGVLITLACVIEIEGSEKPACVAHLLALVIRE